MSEETKNTDENIIGDEEKAVLNKKIAAVTSKLFQALGNISEEQIYELAFTGAGKESTLLRDLIDGAYQEMLKSGGDLPCGHFDHYKKVLTDFCNTFVTNIDAKLESNRDALIAVAAGKTEKPERLSYNDIISALENK